MKTREYTAIVSHSLYRWTEQGLMSRVLMYCEKLPWPSQGAAVLPFHACADCCKDGTIY